MPIKIRKMDETLTVRLDGQTRFALELLARAKQQSISNLIVGEMRKLAERELPKRKIGEREYSLYGVVWDVFPQDRLVKLALHAPELLTEDEQKIWRVISEDRTYLPKRDKPDFAAIRKDWNLIQEKVREYEKSSEG